MEASDYISIIGIIISTVISIIGLYNTKEAKKIINKYTINNDGNNNFISNAKTINVGNSLSDIMKATESVIKPIMPTITNFEKIQNKIDSDNHYGIPIFWTGTEKEYKKLIEENKIDNDMIYQVTPD